jgi:hypothetical protein
VVGSVADADASIEVSTRHRLGCTGDGGCERFSRLRSTPELASRRVV